MPGWTNSGSTPRRRARRTVYTRHDNVIGNWDGTSYVKRAVEGMKNVYGAVFGIRSGGGKPVIYFGGDYVDKEGQPPGGIMASNDGGRPGGP